MTGTMGLKVCCSEITTKFTTTMISGKKLPKGFEEALNFPLADALFGRRARRFSLGASIPDGPLTFTSKHDPYPLSELEKMMVLTAAGGNTGWHYMITRNKKYAPHLSNYSAAAGGRTFPSAAGFHTSELFFTDDTGVYLLETRDAPELTPHAADGTFDVDALIDAHKSRIRKISEGRLKLPPEEPHTEGHNTWCVNRPGSLLIIPVVDMAQHFIALLCYLVQNGYCIFDDINKTKIPGIEKFSSLVDVENPFPLSYADQLTVGECTAEISASCYAGMLMLQAMGLGGWMFDGLERHSVLGASGDPEAPGLGFRFDVDERWPAPNVTGLEGVFEAYCPPHYKDMRAAVEAFAERKFGKGGPFNSSTPGQWKESNIIRGSAMVHSSEFIDCVVLQAQYIFDTFGKFPATIPSIFCLMYLQAHHLDLDFYDHYFKEGAYLHTHANHMKNWHGEK